MFDVSMRSRMDALDGMSFLPRADHDPMATGLASMVLADNAGLQVGLGSLVVAIAAIVLIRSAKRFVDRFDISISYRRRE